MKRKVANIVNFIRAVEPIDLAEPVPQSVSGRELKLRYAVRLDAGRFDGAGRLLSKNGLISAEFEARRGV